MASGTRAIAMLGGRTNDVRVHEELKCSSQNAKKDDTSPDLEKQSKKGFLNDPDYPSKSTNREWPHPGVSSGRHQFTRLFLWL